MVEKMQSANAKKTCASDWNLRKFPTKLAWN